MFSIVIFLSIFSIQIYSEETFDCTGHEDDSFHPVLNANDCRFYWHCIFVNTVYMRAVKRVCPAGTEFDIRLNQCEWSNFVNCVSIKSQKPQIRTTTQSQQLEVLPSIEQLLKKLIAMELQLSSVNSTTTPIIESTTMSTEILPTRKHRIPRDNLTLNILISHERRIRQFPIYSRHGILLYCNEIRRRRLRDLIFRTPPPPTTTRTMINSSSKISHYDILSLTMFLIFTKISD